MWEALSSTPRALSPCLSILPMLCGWDALRPTCQPAVGILMQFVIRLWLHSLLALEGILQTQQEQSHCQMTAYPSCSVQQHSNREKTICILVDSSKLSLSFTFPNFLAPISWVTPSAPEYLGATEF